MNKRLNEYSLNVYQVVCLVIGLCCVWCSAVRNSDEMGLADISKRIMLDIDSQVESVYAAITNAIKELGILRRNQTKQIYRIKQCQQNLEEEKQEASENMNSTQSDCSFSDKSIERLRQEEVYLISQLVREEVIHTSIAVIIRKLNEWLSECRDGQVQKESRITNIGKLANQVKQLNKIKDNPTDLQTQSPDSERSIVESALIKKGTYYYPNALKTRFKARMVKELMKMVPKIDISACVELTEILDSEIYSLLKNDELKSLDNISMIIRKSLVWLDGRSKNMEVKSESVSEQEPTDPEPYNSRTQSIPTQTNESGMDGKLHSLVNLFIKILHRLLMTI
ncbi:hypothetical protein NEHOM01_2396 [Nematocida homosporus]|uniref:uncharacterized protein n=1 Tax=Nematocida homosporus TaxID=1912981 RepID=UPI00221E77E6|nr:uncharacterized protein NEHOM01_2396 [Nematocida homosporus]KAI5187832.1 hypothetical protein NEHOM01_2396 [Nematocida homosporus]